MQCRTSRTHFALPSSVAHPSALILSGNCTVVSIRRWWAHTYLRSLINSYVRKKLLIGILYSLRHFTFTRIRIVTLAYVASSSDLTVTRSPKTLGKICTSVVDISICRTDRLCLSVASTSEYWETFAMKFSQIVWGKLPRTITLTRPSKSILMHRPIFSLKTAALKSTNIKYWVDFPVGMEPR